MSDTPTPRTDAAETYRDGTWACVDASFARQLERELATEREAREKAEEALREIEMECGNPDPSDGEGTSPEEVAQSVTGLKQRAEQAEARIQELQGMPFSDRNYGAMKAKLASAIGLLSVAGCPCPNCDGSGAYQISETEIHQCQWCAERKSLIP